MDRPKWIRVTVTVLCAWLSFWVCLLLLALVFALVNSAFKLGEGGNLVQNVIAIVEVVVILLAPIPVTIAVTRWQKRVLDKESLKVNYIILAILIVLALLFFPAPFVYFIVE